jgi:hypothetical protein
VDIRPTAQPCDPAPVGARFVVRHDGRTYTILVVSDTVDTTIKYDGLLTEKEHKRVIKTQETLNNGGNPFSKENRKDTEVQHKKDHSPIVKKGLTIQERLNKFNSTCNFSGSWTETTVIDPSASPSIITGMLCISCKEQVNAITSVYGRIVVQMIKKVVDYLKLLDNGQLVEAKTVIMFPRYETGYCCNTCFDALHSLKYYTKTGEMKRGIELLEPPIMRVKEEVPSGNGRHRIHSIPLESKTPPMKRDDNYPRGKEKVGRPMTVDLLPNGELSDEEWDLGWQKDKRFEEPVDPTAYRRLFPARRKIG